VLNPQRSNRVGPQVVIDGPAAGAVVDVSSATSFRFGARGTPTSAVLAGWAADLDSQSDTGVDTVHVWAYPLTGAAPIWIGAAAYGGARPDVAEVYGARFKDTGYSIRLQGLEPGTYDIAVFAYSTVKGGFVPARVVRVSVR
jgi:hypothetical protein